MTSQSQSLEDIIHSQGPLGMLRALKDGVSVTIQLINRTSTSGQDERSLADALLVQLVVLALDNIIRTTNVIKSVSHF